MKLNLFNKHTFDYARLDELKERKGGLVNYKKHLESLLKDNPYEEGTLNHSKFLYAKKQLGKKIYIANKKLQKVNWQINKERLRLAEDYLLKKGLVIKK